MTGMLLLAAVGSWIWLAFRLSKWITSLLQLPKWNGLVAVAIFLVLLPIPVADELAGRFQFNTLCNNATLRIDAEKARGKTIRVVIDPSNRIVPGQILVTLHSHFSLRDTETGEEVAQYDAYVVKGGVLIRMLGISEGTSPLTIGRPYCAPEDRGKIDKKYGFTQVN